MSGYVYFASFRPNFIKIGYSLRPANRVGMICRRPTARIPVSALLGRENATIIGVLPGTRKTEKEMHRKFSKYRVPSQQEWFWDAGKIRDHIAELRLSPPPPRTPRSKDLVNIVVPEPLHKRLKALAKATRYPVKVLVEDALNAFLIEKEPKKKVAGK